MDSGEKMSGNLSGVCYNVNVIDETEYALGSWIGRLRGNDTHSDPYNLIRIMPA